MMHNSPTIRNSTISDTAGNGVEIESGSAPTIEKLTLNNNTDYGIQYAFLTRDLPNLSGPHMSGNGMMGSAWSTTPRCNTRGPMSP